MAKILGVDYGEARTGLAISDQTETIATALPAWEARGKVALAEYLRELVRQHNIEKIVLGLPKNMDGSLGKMAQDVLKLKEDLTEFLHLQAILWDERLSTISAHKFLKDHQVKTKKNKKMVDTISAVLILQSYLDSQKR